MGVRSQLDADAVIGDLLDPGFQGDLLGAGRGGGPGLVQVRGDVGGERGAGGGDLGGIDAGQGVALGVVNDVGGELFEIGAAGLLLLVRVKPVSRLEAFLARSSAWLIPHGSLCRPAMFAVD